MPRFYHSSDADLSDLNMAKRAVNRDYAKQYHSQDGNHDNLGQTQDVDAVYNALSTKLTGLYGTLSDLYNVVVAPVEIAQNPISSFSTQLIGSLGAYSSRIISECRAITTIMTRIKTFNMFTPPQAQALSEMIGDIDTRSADVFLVSQLLGDSNKAQTIDGILAQYEGDFKTMMQLLSGASNSYKAVANRPAGQGLVGGAIVPAYNGQGHYGSDGYKIGSYYSYNDPCRFY
jgi:hypothetical protein